MRKIFTLTMIFLTCLTYSAFSQQSRLTINFSGVHPVKINLDGKSVNQTGYNNEILINNIRPGYHSIRIYKQAANYGRSRVNQRMQVIYDGNVYVKPGFHVDIIINRFGKSFIDEKLIAVRYSYYDRDNNDYGGGWYNNTYHMVAMDESQFAEVKKALGNESFDNTRLVVAKQIIDQNYFNVSQVKQIVELFSFENNRLEIAKYSYENTIDKNNYYQLNDAFSFSSSRQELAKYIRELGDK